MCVFRLQSLVVGSVEACAMGQDLCLGPEPTVVVQTGHDFYPKQTKC